MGFVKIIFAIVITTSRASTVHVTSNVKMAEHVSPVLVCVLMIILGHNAHSKCANIIATTVGSVSVESVSVNRDSKVNFVNNLSV